MTLVGVSGCNAPDSVILQLTSIYILIIACFAILNKTSQYFVYFNYLTLRVGLPKSSERCLNGNFSLKNTAGICFYLFLKNICSFFLQQL